MSLDKANQWAYDNPGKFIVATFISYLLCFSCVFVFLDSIGPEEEKPELVSPEEVSKILGYDPANYSFMEKPKYKDQRLTEREMDKAVIDMMEQMGYSKDEAVWGTVQSKLK